LHAFLFITIHVFIQNSNLMSLTTAINPVKMAGFGYLTAAYFQKNGGQISSLNHHYHHQTTAEFP